MIIWIGRICTSKNADRRRCVLKYQRSRSPSVLLMISVAAGSHSSDASVAPDRLFFRSEIAIQLSDPSGGGCVQLPPSTFTR